MKRRPPELDGFLNIDKPAGLTSCAIVDRVCRIVNSKRVGHAGTLDPLATGVLVVAVGKATRLVEYVQMQRKTYRAGFLLGRTSDTDDVEGEVHIRENFVPPTQDQIETALGGFLGVIQQTPPRFSAVKLQGRRAYDLARAGKETNIAPRPVEVFHIAVQSYSFPQLQLEIECGSGTYIRSIARDLGEVLGVGGLMETLQRTAIGVFRLDGAVGLEALEREDWRTHLRPLQDGCAELPKVELTEELRGHFDAGREFDLQTECEASKSEFAATFGGELLGIGVYDAERQVGRSIKGGFADSEQH